MVSPSYRIDAVNNLVHVALRPGFCIGLADMQALWRDVHAACAARGMRHVLIEGEQPTRALHLSEIPLHAELVAGGAAPLRVAFCLYDYPVDELTQQFIAGANRGRCSLQVFDELGSALRWLGA